MRDLSEQPLFTETIFEGESLTLKKDTVRLPDGKRAAREYVVRPHGVIILPLFDDDRVLLTWQYRYPIGKHLLEVPAGKCDSGEPPEAAARRELAEETGYAADRWRALTTVHLAAAYATEAATLFLAQGLRAVPRPKEAGEFTEVRILPVEALFGQLDRDELADAKTALALWWLRSHPGGAV